MPLVLLAIWQSHYIYRALIYPFRLGAHATPMPWSIALMGFSFNIFNAYLNARWISHLGDYADATLAFYGSLSAEQQQVFDANTMGMGGHHGPRGPGGMESKGMKHG